MEALKMLCEGKTDSELLLIVTKAMLANEATLIDQTKGGKHFQLEHEDRVNASIVESIVRYVQDRQKSAVGGE